jgi:hypothetical protein
VQVSLERAERDELEDFVMIADLHKPSVKSPRSSDTSEPAPNSSQVKAQTSSAGTEGTDGGYVEHGDDKYSLASVIERTADIAPPVDDARDLHGLEESMIVEESPSENTGTHCWPASKVILAHFSAVNYDFDKSLHTKNKTLENCDI